MRQSGKWKTASLRGSSGFTLVELIATIAIVAMLVAVMVPFIGNYVAEAKKTADRQTLAVLNDALTRYKTQGGSLAALTVGADIQNVLTELRTPISWAGMQHQVLKTGDTYASEDLSVSGNGSSYKFTRYGTYIDGTSYASNIVSDVGGVGDSAAFETWMANAMAETGSTNYLALTNPDTTDRFGIYARVANSGDKVRVWWGDGTTENFDSISTSSSTVIAKVFGSSAARTIVIVGDISFIYSANNEGLGGDGSTYFGGDISTMTSLNHLNVQGSNTLSGSITTLRSLTTLSLWGSNSVSGSIEELTNLNYLYVSGNNTVTGSLTGLTNLYFIGIWGSNTITGSISGMPIEFLIPWGNSNIEVNSIIDITGTATGLSYINLGNNYPLTQTQTDTILTNMDANKNETKPRSERTVDINEANHAAPSATGLAAKTNLLNAGWTVSTN